jgi:hypothetical protein
MKKLGPQVFALAVLAVAAFPAAGQTLLAQSDGGMDPLKVAYLSAAATPLAAGVAEAKNVEIDRVHWDRVTFHSEGGRRLVHVQLWTKAQTYAQLKARLADPNDSLWTLLDNSGVQNASAGGSDMMICNHGASGVVLSFDRSMAAPSPVQIAAARSDIRNPDADAVG